jgi:DNA-binding MarR family transcriptional regulator
MSRSKTGSSGAKQQAAVPPAVPMQDLIQARINRIDEVINQLARYSIGTRGLRPTDLRILNILYDTDAVSINELARRAHVDKAWISRSVVQLLEKKLISKQRDPRDSRAQLVRLTPKSRRLMDQVRPQVQSNERFLLQGIDEVAFKRNMDLLLENAAVLLDQLHQAAGRRRPRTAIAEKPAKR